MKGLVNKWILYLSDGVTIEGCVVEQIDSEHYLVLMRDVRFGPPHSVVLSIAGLQNTAEHSCCIFDTENDLDQYAAWLMAEPDKPKLVPFGKKH
jgi:hypothetical protein